MKGSFREVKLYGGFPAENGGMSSLKARAYLKRIFMGRLVPLPPEITEGMAPYEPPVEIPVDKPNKDFKILYAVGNN